MLIQLPVYYPFRLDSGKIFGSCGEGFQRLNVACPRAVLEEALLRLKRALDARAVSAKESA